MKFLIYTFHLLNEILIINDEKEEKDYWLMLMIRSNYSRSEMPFDYFYG